ncbi:MAG: type II toxin-antitoxin system VapC family toxin [Pirellulales bacterium]|nr:type II toxin-antitoxin system VapC family toxin [Pirellulales bacterium]
MKPRVYVETTIPSFYCETRADSESVARRNWTQHWWDFKRAAYEIYISPAVLDELHDGDYPTKEIVLSLVAGIAVLPVDDEVLDIVATYIRRALMPADPTGDALHLALASYHNCDFLLTWNCQHLANANKFQHIRVVNNMLGLHVPNLVTPLELLGEDT